MKKSRNQKLISALCLLVLMIATMTACDSKKTDSHDEYTCPMHPEIVKEKPGNCPVCGMTLVKKKPQERTSSSSETGMKKNSNGFKNPMLIILPSREINEYTINLDGVISADERNRTVISARFSGRVGKLFLTSPFQHVSKGEKIMEIYSPDLLAILKDLDFVLNHDKDNTTLINQLTTKIRIMNISDLQFNDWRRSGNVPDMISVFSSVEGDMVPGSGNVREGDYIQAGQPVFEIVDSNSVWIDFRLHRNISQLVKLNEQVSMRIDNESISGRIDFIEPFIKDGDSFLIARVRLPNTENRFIIGQMVEGSIAVREADLLWVPRTSVMNLGTRNVVFVQKQGVLSPKEVRVSGRIDGLIGIAQGIDVTDSVASDSQILENLISNAVKFSPFGKNVEILITAPNDYACIDVRDHGPGIQPEEAHKLFGKFQRLSARPTGGEPSMGLGLSIVKALVATLDGKISFTSEPGIRTTFSVRLPAR